MRYYIPRPHFFVCTCLFIFSFGNLLAQEVRKMMDASDLAISEGAYIEALGTLSKVLLIDEENSEAYNLRGVCFEKLDQFENASESYRRAIKADQSYPAPYLNLGLIYMAEGKGKEAIHLFEKYIWLNPTDATGWTQKGISYLFMEKLDSAFFFLNRAIDTDKTADRAWLYRGYCWSMLGQYERAIADLDEAVKLNPNGTHYYVRADLKMEMGDTHDAISDLTKAIEDDPLLVNAKLSRANAYLMEKKYNQCLEDVEAVLKEEPGNERALNYKAWAYFYEKDFDKALTIARSGKLISSKKYNFDHLIGRCLMKLEQFDQAKNSFKKAIDLEPYRTDNYQLLAASILFMKTNPKKIIKDNDVYLFKDIYSNNLSQMNQWIGDPNHPYYYPHLMNKYNSDFSSLSYDEYFMLYFGHTEQDQYDPYSVNTKKQMQGFDKYFETEDYKACVLACEAFLKENPFIIEPYLYAGSAYFKMGQLDKYSEYMFKYHALLESIKLTGDGKSIERAFIVGSPAEEYDLLFYLGYESSDQSLLHKDGHDYDVLQVNKLGNPKEKFYLYFNVDKPYQALLKEFNEETTEMSNQQRINVRPGGE